MINDRQKNILKYIIDEYVSFAEPISSNGIIEKYMPKISSATIRNEMVILEKEGLIEKTHSSSGRIPTVDGYKFYEHEFLKPKINSDIKQKLETIFSNRQLMVESVINQSIDIINNTLQLPVVVSSNSSSVLKKFDLIKMSNNSALIIVVTSGSDIFKTEINIKNEKQFPDIITCIHVLNDRLIDTPISELNNKISSIKEILKEKIKSYEFCIQNIITKIFDANFITPKANINGIKYLTTKPEFKNIEKLNKILSFLEDTSVWNYISNISKKSPKTIFTYSKDISKNDDLVIASTSINLNDSDTKLAIVGPTRMDFSTIQWILDYLKKEIEKYIKQK